MPARIDFRDQCKRCSRSAMIVEQTGLCRACLDHERTQARAHDWDVPAQPPVRRCSAADCLRRAGTRGLCRLHYGQRWKASRLH